MKYLLYVVFLFFIFLFCNSSEAVVNYNAGTNTITVTGGTVAAPVTMTDVYNADITGGWNVIYKYNASMYRVNCYIDIGNGVTPTNFTINSEHLEWYDQTTVSNDYFDIEDVTKTVFFKSSFYCIRQGGDDRFIWTDLNDENIEVEIDQCSIFHSTSSPLYLRNYDGRVFINDSTSYGLAPYMPGHYEFQNSTMLSTYYGFRDCSPIVNNFYMTASTYVLHPHNRVSGKYNITNAIMGDTNNAQIPTVLIYATLPSLDLRLIDCTSTHTSNLFKTSWGGGYQSDAWNRSNTFNLVTEPNANVKLYDINNNLLFNINSDNNGTITEQVIDVITHNDTIEYTWHSPFTLIITKPGYQKYTATFNNSLQKIDYIINLQRPYIGGQPYRSTSVGSIIGGLLGFIIGIISIMFINKNREEEE